MYRSSRNVSADSLRFFGFIALFIVLIAFMPMVCVADVTAGQEDVSGENALPAPVWAEMVDKRDTNTRVWEVTKWVEVANPITNEVETVQVKSKVAEKGGGICYLNENGQYQVSQIEWTETEDGFILDKANYLLSIGKTAGDYLDYYVDGERLQLRPTKIMAVDSENSQVLSQVVGTVCGVIDSENKNILVFKNAFGNGIDLQLEAHASGFHQNVVFNNKLALPEGFSAETTSVKLYTEMGLNEYMATGRTKNAVLRSAGDTAEFSVDSSGISSGEATGKINGNIRFVAKDGMGNDSPLHSFVASDIFEVNESSSRSKIATATKEIVNDGTNTYLVESLDAKILTDASNPVVWDYHEVSGYLATDETWNADLTHVLIDDFYINSGVTLTIEPGTVIKGRSGYGIYCEGTIIAKGEPHAYITFTSSKDSTIGEAVETGTPAASDWDGLLLCGGDDIEFCRINYSDYGMHYVEFPRASVIQNNIISNASTGIILYVEGYYSTPVAASVCNNLITDVNIGIRVYYPGYPANREVILRNNTIDAQTNGINVNDGSNNQVQAVQIYNNLITGATTCIAVYNADITENNNAFYDYTTTVDGGHDTSDKTLSASPYESVTTQLGSYYLNETTGGGADIDDEGYGNVEDYYDDPSQWAIHHVSNDGEHYLSSAVFISSDIILEPDYSVCDTGVVAIGYHHPRIDYLFNQVAFVDLGGVSPEITVAPGTVIATSGYVGYDAVFNAAANSHNPILLVNANFCGQRLPGVTHMYSLGYVPAFESDCTLDGVEISGYNYLIIANSNTTPVCSFENSKLINCVGAGVKSNIALTMENCLFVNCDKGATAYSGARTLTFVNCEFLQCDVGVEDPIAVRNCLFRSCGIGIDGTYISETYNAFYENTTNIDGGTIDSTDYDDTELGSTDFYDGWTEWSDRSYLPQTSTLVDAGDPTDSAMYGFTTDVDHADDSNTRDIGYHYTIPKWYVNGSVATSGSGLSWDDCFKELSEALINPDMAAGDQIWVAAGTYTPAIADPTYPRESVFDLPDGVRIYGGFDGTETSLDDRNYKTNETILSGDIGTPDEMEDNCYGVVESGVNAVLDGFTIRDGYCLDIMNQYLSGAGLFISDYMQVRNCVVTNCMANYLGGGICVNNTSADISNCLLTYNVAAGGAGIGASYVTGNEQEPLNLHNLTIAGNYTISNVDSGGGIYIENNTNTNVVSSILWANSHCYYDEYDELVSVDDDIAGYNSTVYVSYSDVTTMDVFDASGITDVDGNISVNPLFADEDFSLMSAAGHYYVSGSTPVWTIDLVTSACVDAGDPSIDCNEPDNVSRVNMGFNGNTPYASKIEYGSVDVDIDGDPSDSGRWAISNIYTGWDSGWQSEGLASNIPTGIGYVIDFEVIHGYETPSSISISTIDEGYNDLYEGEYTNLQYIYVSIDGSASNDGTSSYPLNSIGDGIACADEGDAVYVLGSGVTFKESRLSFNGKNITVWSATPRGVTIDAEENGRLFSFDDGETSSAVLRDFILINGRGIGGGGIRIYDASPTIYNCRIEDCESSGNGGGIYMVNTTAQIIDCHIEGCKGLWGGGVYMDPNDYNDWGVLSNCNIWNNTATSSSPRGGGVYIRDGGVLMNCDLYNNNCSSSASKEIYHDGTGTCRFISNFVQGTCSVDSNNKLVGTYVTSGNNAYAVDY